MTQKSLVIRSGENATSAVEKVLSKLKCGNGKTDTYHQHVVRDYVLGLGSNLTSEDDLKLVLKENKFYRSVFFDILRHNGPLLDIFSAFRNCTSIRDAVYFVKPMSFEEAWDNVSCIYGSMDISGHEAHFFKNVLNVLGVKSTFKFDRTTNRYFVKIYCGSIATLNMKLFTIRRFIPRIMNYRSTFPLIRDDQLRFRFLQNPNYYIIITNDCAWFKGLRVKKWSFETINGYECLKLPCGVVHLDDWRVYITI